MNLQLLLVSALSLLLIGIYVASLIGIIFPEGKILGDDGVRYAFSAAGGLVTAFALSFLAVADPKTGPTEGLALTTETSGSLARTIQKAIPLAFVLTWFITGAAIFYFGLFAQEIVPELTEGAKAWFGTVLAAVGAYWGIKR